MNKFSLKLISVIDIFILPFVYPSALLLKFIRKVGIQRVPKSKNALLNIGVFPIKNHYYEPQFDFRDKKYSFSEERRLPGIDFNIKKQLKFLSKLKFSEEFKELKKYNTDDVFFDWNSGVFSVGDAEFWYQLIRLKKPRRIIEIGSGNSTLLAIRAVYQNRKENPNYLCKHICIEPYEMPWLEKRVFLL